MTQTEYAEQWAECIRQRLLNLAGTKFGASHDDLNSRMPSNRRPMARAEFQKLMESGELHIFAGKRGGATLFVSAADGEAWIASGRPRRPRAATIGRPVGASYPKPARGQPKLIDIRDKSQPAQHWRKSPSKPAAGATVCPANLDDRYTVRELPAGYQSALNPAECRGWAVAVAAR